MWIFAYTIKRGEYDLSDHFTVWHDEQKARGALASMIETEPGLHCACVAQIKVATEPHWVKP